MDSNDNEQIDARLRDAFSDELPDASAVQSAVRKRIAWERSRQWLLAGAAALILLTAAGYLVVGRVHRSRVYAELARDHHREVVKHETRRWRTEPGEIGVLAARYGLSASMAEAVAPEGYRLEHAKTCGMDGKPVLHLVYTNGSREISIYIRQRNGADLSGANLSGVASLNVEQVAAFQTRRFEAVVVTDGPSRECLEFARMAARIL